ncbi:hypothetical protein A6R68_04417, partial [Neotoma lepida]
MGVHTPAAAAAALHIPLINGGGDISVAEALNFQGVLITAEVDCESKFHTFYETHMTTEVAADALGEE